MLKRSYHLVDNKSVKRNHVHLFKNLFVTQNSRGFCLHFPCNSRPFPAQIRRFPARGSADCPSLWSSSRGGSPAFRTQGSRAPSTFPATALPAQPGTDASHMPAAGTSQASSSPVSHPLACDVNSQHGWLKDSGETAFNCREEIHMFEGTGKPLSEGGVLRAAGELRVSLPAL